MGKIGNVMKDRDKMAKLMPEKATIESLRAYTDDVLQRGARSLDAIIEDEAANAHLKIQAYNSIISLSKHIDDRQKYMYDLENANEEMLDDLSFEDDENEEEDSDI